MPYIHMTRVRKILLASFSISLWFISLIAYLLFTKTNLGEVFLYIPRAGIYFPVSENFNIGILVATLTALLPYATITYFNDRYIDDIERTLPDVFKALAEGVQAGLTLPYAIRDVGRRGYSVLGKLLNMVAARMALGLSFENALDATFAKYGIPSLKRAAKILKIAYESGGRTFKVLDTAAKVYGLLWSYTYERRTSVRQYVITIYASLLVFLFIGMILIEAFFIPLTTLQKAQPVPIFKGLVDIPVYKAVILYTAFIEALLGGLIAGKMARGSIKSGVLHIVVQLFIVIIFFALVIPSIERFGLFPVIVSRA